jgi:predicted AAA+ superfamily ATPase
LTKKQSVLILGPHQAGETTLARKSLEGVDAREILLQNPGTRLEFEKDPAALIRQTEAAGNFQIIFLEEAGG